MHFVANWDACGFGTSTVGFEVAIDETIRRNLACKTQAQADCFSVAVELLGGPLPGPWGVGRAEIAAAWS